MAAAARARANRAAIPAASPCRMRSERGRMREVGRVQWYWMWIDEETVRVCAQLLFCRWMMQRRNQRDGWERASLVCCFGACFCPPLIPTTRLSEVRGIGALRQFNSLKRLVISPDGGQAKRVWKSTVDAIGVTREPRGVHSGRDTLGSTAQLRPSVPPTSNFVSSLAQRQFVDQLLHTNTRTTHHSARCRTVIHRAHVRR